MQGKSWVVLAAAVLATALLDSACARLLWHSARVDRTPALFASVTGGATEMAVLGERFGGKPELSWDAARKD